MNRLLNPQEKSDILHIFFWGLGALGVGICILFILDIILFLGGGEVMWSRAGFLPFIAVALLYISRKGLKKHG
jgi:hypothetical protein